MNIVNNHKDNIQNAQRDSIDIEKALSILRRSVIWIILIFIATITAAYLTVRWTKPVYESSSELKLDVKSEASEFGLPSLSLTENKNLNIISGEIELLKSKLFLNKVIETVDLDVSYYTAGHLLNDEKYTVSPLKVEYDLKDKSLYDHRIYIEIINENLFRLSFDGEENFTDETYQFGEVIKMPRIDFVLYTTKYYDPQGDKKYFFTINSNGHLLQYFERNLTVEPLNLNANTIRIALKDHNKYKARDLVNAIDTIYLNYTQEEKNRENKQKIAWLNEELDQIEKELESYEDYFEDFTIQNRTSDLDEDLKKTIASINKLDSQRFELTQKLKGINQLQDALKDSISGAEINPQQYPPFIVEQTTKLEELIQEKNELKLSYSEATFVLSKKEQEIEATKTRLFGQLSTLEDKYQMQIRDLIRRKNQLESNFVEIPEKSTEYNKKQRFFDLYEEFYLSLMQSKAQYQIAQAGTTTEFKILSSATLPETAIFPNKLLIYGIGLVSGFFISFIFVSIRYLAHNKITSAGELERIASVPLLGTVPFSAEKLEQTKLVIDKNPKSAVSEALRSLRTNIEFMITGKKDRVISITSTIGGEGKTFIAVNLGGIIALSRKKVLLLDLDMRKPRVHLAFNHPNPDKGVSTVLINKHAKDLFDKGRDQTLLSWINLLPESEIVND
ncbi:MAG: Wzz/FepE/Etk N-terminal domain-containing protein, partial [Fulvivirga sp.]|nr:Wzz/FepE/Etk N-terminal domain-containing protein [Fulvivirga sp.]